MGSLTEGTPVESQVWGWKPYNVSQPFGEYNAALAEWYQYASSVGWPAGTHVGLDVAVPKYTPIFANEDGTVEHAGWSDSFRPNPVYVRENDGDLAIYGHLWEAGVAQGKHVKRGDFLGYSGEQTVRGTMVPDGSGPHIHYELRNAQGIAVDPAAELTERAQGDESWRDTSGEYKRPGTSMGVDLSGFDELMPKVLTVGIGVVLVAIGLKVFLGVDLPGPIG